MKSFKTQLDLNNKQRTLCAQHAGVARHAWNWGLDVCLEALNSKLKLPTAIDLHKRLVAEVKVANPWYYDVSKCAPQQALRNLETAWKRCFKKLAKKPKRKKKNKSADSFYLDGSFKVDGSRIKLPRIGWVRTHELLPSDLVVGRCVVSKRGGKWFVSFNTESVPAKTVKTKGAIGVDVGLKSLAVLSDGTVFENPRSFQVQQAKLSRLSRKLSRQKKGSSNRAKTKEKLSRLHYRISCIRADHLHKLTSYLAKNHSRVVIEDLCVRGMLKNRKLAKSVADAGLYELRRQLEYKCQWYGSELVVADRWYPSSKTCSCCGLVKDSLSLSERIFECKSCGLVLDRDLNAAKNLEQVGSSSILACGESVRPGFGLAVLAETGIKHFSHSVAKR